MEGKKCILYIQENKNEVHIKSKGEKCFSGKENNVVLCGHLPIIQSVLAQLLAHVTNLHTGQRQQGPGISHLQHIGYRFSGLDTVCLIAQCALIIIFPFATTCKM